MTSEPNPADTTGEGSSETFKEIYEKYSEEDLATLLLVIGGIMLLSSEPTASYTGFVLMLTSFVVLFADWLSG